MPVLIALAGIAAAISFFVLRARHAAQAGAELLDVANDVRLAARRIGFRRKADLHPAETIEDPNIAIASIATAFLEMDDLPTADQRTALTRRLVPALDISAEDAGELMVLGRWMVGECGGPDAAVSRLGRKLYRLSGSDGFEPLMAAVQAVAQSGSGNLSQRQSEALDDIKRAFRIS